MTSKELINFFGIFKKFKLKLKNILKFNLFDNDEIKIIVEDIHISKNIIGIFLYQIKKNKYMIIKIPCEKFYCEKNNNVNEIEFIDCPVFFDDKCISYDEFKEEISIKEYMIQKDKR